MIKSIYTKWEEISANIPEAGKMNVSEYFLSKKSNNKMYFGIDSDKNKKVYVEFDKDALNNYVCPEIVGMKIARAKASYIDSNKVYLTVLNESETEEVFLAFTSTLADNILDSKSNAKTINEFEKTLKFYKDYFSNPNKSLSDSEEQGLCGELLYLKELIETKGEDSVIYWLGPNKNKRDFVFEKSAVEVKSTLNQTETSITISNENQLDPSKLDELKLVVYIFEKDPNGKIDVISCANSIYHSISDVQYCKAFIAKMIQLGVNLNEYKIRNKYTCQDKKFYIIDQDFPSIRKSNIPSVVFNVKYKINLNSLDKYLEKE